MKRSSTKNQGKTATTDEPTLAEPSPIESEPSLDAAPQEPTDAFFFDTVAAITDAEWDSRYVVYLYRTAPKISLPGERHHIAKLTSGFDESTIQARYGSGQYHARLNDKKLRRTVATHLFSVYDPNKPPSIDPALIVDCPENEPFLKWKKSSDATAAGMENGASAVVAEIAREAMRKPKTSEVSDTLLLGMAQGRDALAEKLAGLSAQPSAADPIAALSSAADLIKKFSGDGKAATDPLAALDRAVELIRKLQPPAPVPVQEAVKNPIEQVDEVLNLVTKLKERFPVAAVETGDGGSTLQAAAAIVATVADLVKQPLNVLMQIWASKQAPHPAAPAAAARTQQSEAAPTGAGVPVPVPVQSPPPGTDGASAPPLQFALLQIVAPVLMNYMRDGMSGGDFAQWIYDGYGPEWQGLSWITMKTAIGPAGIVEMFRQSPYWAELQLIEPKFVQFVGQFVDWQPGEEPDRETSEHGASDIK